MTRHTGITLAVVMAACLAVPAAAGASGTSPTSKKVAGAHTAVSSCGSLSGISVSWTVVDDTVVSIRLGSIPAACNGGTLHLTLVDSGNASLGSAGPVAVTGTSQTLSSVSGSPAAMSVAGAHLSVVGP